MALYKVVMNINEDGCRPHGWHGLDGDRCIKHDTPTNALLKISVQVFGRIPRYLTRDQSEYNFGA